MKNKKLALMIRMLTKQKKEVCMFSMQVYSFARIIGEYEGLDQNRITLLELAALNVMNSKVEIIRQLEGSILNDEEIESIATIVTRERNPDEFMDLNEQIFLEAKLLAEYLLNRVDSAVMTEKKQKMFRTKGGKEILDSLLGYRR